MLRISAFSRLQRGKYVKVSPHSRYYKKKMEEILYCIFVCFFKALALAETGLYIGNSQCTILGDPQKGTFPYFYMLPKYKISNSHES